MADDWHSNLPALGTLAPGIAGATAVWLASRLVGKAAFQTAINQGFSELTNRLQEERNKLHEDFLKERRAWAKERAELHLEILEWKRAVENFKALLRMHGFETPDDPISAIVYRLDGKK